MIVGVSTKRQPLETHVTHVSNSTTNRDRRLPTMSDSFLLGVTSFLLHAVLFAFRLKYVLS